MVKEKSNKTKVFEELKAKENELISGQEIADKLHISRAMVSKIISEIANCFPSLKTVKNKGYILQSAVTNSLCDYVINSAINERGYEAIVYKEVGSTNFEAKKGGLEASNDKVVIIAEKQNAGRGRLGRTFYSPKNSGIYMSILLRGKIKNSPILTAIIAVSVARATRRNLGVELGIKWVNDLFYNGKKVVGILTEAVTEYESGGVDFAVVGIGINCSKAEFPSGLENVATYISESEIDRNALIISIIEEFDKIVEDESYLLAMEEYRALSIIIGKVVTVYQQENSFEALVVGIDNDGTLEVERDGVRLKLRSGEVSKLKK